MSQTKSDERTGHFLDLMWDAGRQALLKARAIPDVQQYWKVLHYHMHQNPMPVLTVRIVLDGGGRVMCREFWKTGTREHPICQFGPESDT